VLIFQLINKKRTKVAEAPQLKERVKLPLQLLILIDDGTRICTDVHFPNGGRNGGVFSPESQQPSWAIVAGVGSGIYAVGS
jgi:hypothetical protein